MELILKPNRIRYIGLLMVSLLFAAEGAFLIEKGQKFGWLAVLFFGSGGIVFCLQLLPGSSYLKLGGSGFTLCTLFRPRFYPWSDVDSFEVGRIIALRKMVLFNYSRLRRGHESIRKLNSRIVGFEGALPDTYGMSAEKLAATLNEWRQRAGYST